MIIMFSMFFFEKKMHCLSLFSQIVAAMYHSTTKLTDFRGTYASKFARQRNETAITPERKFSSVITKLQDLIKQQFKCNIHITACG